MAADLHIHVLRVGGGILKRFNSSSLGSKWFDTVTYSEHSKHFSDDYDAISKCPNIWIGEVSWLKAALSEDAEAYVPTVVEQVNEVIGEDLPEIDDGLITRLEAAFQSPNVTGYDVASWEKVRRFLNEYRGERVFTVSW